MTGNDDGARLAEEIRLLVDLVVDRAAPWLEGVIAAGHGTEEPGGENSGEHSGEHDGEPRPRQGACSWCPLCAVVAVVRGERPELAARVLEQAAQLVALLRAVLADRWQPQEGVHMPGFEPEPRPEPAGNGAAPRVQHVAVRPRAEWEHQES
ncbi:hypothetical protein [Prauserella cavernicola]|uniref:Uncharacterized protein n=1 Tax=Prauserella cavernicola TaxID=2800127 RepID=A0A934V4R1_9PSEU|nr:hypothetical protein [Prauserella cavernicola]MBK1788636.1 hypothetical protein [Prauserella cavernicola]